MKKRLFAMLLAVVTVATSINVTGIQARADEDGSAYVEVIDAESDSDEEIILEEISEEELTVLESQETIEDTVEEDATTEEAVEEDVTAEEAVEEDVTAEEAVEEDVTAEEAVEEDVTAEEAVEEDVTTEEAVEEDTNVEEIEEEDATTEELVEEDAAIIEEEEDVTAEVLTEEEVFETDLEEEVELYEANTSMSRATTLAANTKKTGTVNNDIAHWYKFTTPSNCVYYTMSLVASSSSAYMWVCDEDQVSANGTGSIYASANNVRTYNYKLEPNKTYYIMVSLSSILRENASYTLSYTTTKDVADTKGSAQSIILGKKYSDTLCTLRDNDYYTFTTGSDCAYYKLVVTASNREVEFIIRDSDGVNPLAYGNQIFPGTNASETLYLKLDRNTKYYIDAYNTSSSYYNYTYSLTLTKVADIPDTSGSAASIVSNTKYQDTLASSKDEDWYKFTGGAGTYTFTANNVSAGDNFYVKVMDANGVIKATMVPGNSNAVTKSIQLPAGTYYVVAYNNGNISWGLCNKLGEYNFKFTTTAGQNGLVKASNGTYYYYVNGIVNTSYSGIVKSGSKYYYVTNGVLKWGVNGLTNYNGTWYYIKNSTFDSSYSGLYNWQGAWYYITNGVLKWGVNGVTSYGGKYYYVNNSQITWKDTGIVAFNGGYYYFQNSQFKPNYSGLAQYGKNWYYVTNGILKWGVNGCAQYGGKWYYVRNSKVDFSYTGYTTWGGKRYRVVNGVVQL